MKHSRLILWIFFFYFVKGKWNPPKAELYIANIPSIHNGYIEKEKWYINTKSLLQFFENQQSHIKLDFSEPCYHHSLELIELVFWHLT